MRSQVIAHYPLARCLMEAQTVFGGEMVPWSTVNDPQEVLYTTIFDECRKGALTLPGAECIATCDVGVCGAFVQKHCLTGVEPVVLGDGEMALLSSFSLIPRLKNPVIPTVVCEGRYRAVSVENVHIFPAIYHYEEDGEEKTAKVSVVGLDAENGDHVYVMSLPDFAPKDMLHGFEWLEFLDQLHHSLRHVPKPTSVVLPLVDYVDTTEILWMQGMHAFGAGNRRFRIARAIARAELRLETTEQQTDKTLDPDLVFDRPFMLWVERFGYADPILLAVLMQDSWKMIRHGT